MTAKIIHIRNITGEMHSMTKKLAATHFSTNLKIEENGISISVMRTESLLPIAKDETGGAVLTS